MIFFSFLFTNGRVKTAISVSSFSRPTLVILLRCNKRSQVPEYKNTLSVFAPRVQEVPKISVFLRKVVKRSKVRAQLLIFCIDLLYNQLYERNYNYTAECAEQAYGHFSVL